MKYEKKVSICMMIKNEENNLERCLKSLQPIVTAGLCEIIVIDTGSEDKSIDIAKRYTNKVYEHPWTNNFSEMRNISISYAKGEWIWIMDADEEVENPEEVVKLFQTNLSKYNTMTVKIKSYTSNFQSAEESEYNLTIIQRIFRNRQDFKYDGTIHEQPASKPPFHSSDLILRHYGYIWKDREFTKRKFERTVGILTEELKKQPNNIYFQFQLAVSWSTIDYTVGLQEIRKARAMINKLPHKDRGVYAYIYGIYAKIAYANEKYEEVIEICKEGLTFSKDHIDLWFHLGLASAAIKDDIGVVNYFKAFLKLRERFYQTDISKDPAFTFYCVDDNTKDTALYNVAVVFLKRKEYAEALFYAKSIKTYELKSKLIAKIIVEDKMQYVLEKYLNEIVDNENAKSGFINLLEQERISQEKRISLAKDIIKYYELNKKADEYYLLNIIRMLIADKSFSDKETIEKIMKLNFDNIGDYYGDIIAYIIKCNMHPDTLQNLGDLRNINRFMKYVLSVYEGIQIEFAHYLIRNEGIIGLGNARNWLVLAKNVLLSGELDESNYMQLFNQYIVKGKSYIHKVYTEKVLQEPLYDISNEEHRFFFYMEKAFEMKDKDAKAYILYLRKSLNEQPMKTGIELLLKDINNAKNNIQQNINEDSQFEEYKKVVKKNISTLINQNKLDEAKRLITQYEDIVKKDEDIFSIKGVIAIMEGDFEAAEKVLQEGASINEKKFDLLYNLAYLYEVQEKYVMAYRYYENAFKLENKEMKREIREKLEQLESIEAVNLYKHEGIDNYEKA